MTQTKTTHADRIIDAIRELNAYTGAEWSDMGAIREVSGLTRPQFDAAMTRLAIARLVVLVPEDNQKVLTDADWYNAVHVGGEDKHLAQLA